jgi:hypothetical protein
MMGKRIKAHRIQPYEKLPTKMPLNKYKSKAKGIVKDFCLPVDIYKELTKKIDNANTEYEVDIVLKEARNYI